MVCDGIQSVVYLGLGYYWAVPVGLVLFVGPVMLMSK